MWPRALNQRRHKCTEKQTDDEEPKPQQQQEHQPVMLLCEMTRKEQTTLLLSRQPSSSPTATSTTTSLEGSAQEEDDEDAWESLDPTTAPASTASTPSSPHNYSRVWYLATHTVPILLFDALRLGLFVILLAPAFASFLWYYFTCDRQVLRYKDKDHDTAPCSLRHVVDVYGAVDTQSTNNTTKKPVLIFFTGGAWVIGYKMWGAFLAKVFAAMGVLVVIPDYPNYPFVTVPQMVDDAELAIQWTLNTIGK